MSYNIPSDIAYGVSWNGNFQSPTKNAVYDIIAATISGGANTALSNLASVAINTSLLPGVTDTIALGSTTKNWSDLFLGSGATINFDVPNAGSATITHSASLLTSNVDIVVPDEVYGVGWNGSLEVPTKNAVYDKIEAVIATIPSTITVANEASDTTSFLGFFTDATGNLQPKTNVNMTFNASTGVATFASTVLTTTDINGGTIDGAVIGGVAAAAGTFSAVIGNSFVPNLATVPTNGMYLPSANTLGFAINSAAELQLTSTALSPAANDGNALGTTALQWSDIFLAEGGVINWDNGDATLTQVGNVVTLAGADLVTDTTTVNTGLMPDANDGAYLGQSGTAFSDLFLASGAVINFAASDMMITHATGSIAIGKTLSNSATNMLYVEVTATPTVVTNTSTTNFDLTGLFLNNEAAIIQGSARINHATLNTGIILGTTTGFNTPVYAGNKMITNGGAIASSKFQGSTPVSITVDMTSATNLRVVVVYGSAPGAAATSVLSLLVNNGTF